MIQGANAPLLEKSIKEQIQIEKEGGQHTGIALDFTKNQKSQDQLSIGQSIRSSSQEVSEKDPELQKTLAIIKPDAMAPSAIEHILAVIKKNHFKIVEKKKLWLSIKIITIACS